MSWYLAVLRKYADFSGRARRREYWFFVLINTVIIIALAVLDGFLGTLSAQAGIGLLSGLYALAVLIPAIAVGVRRLHDTGRHGLWILINLLPIVGPIVFLVFMLLNSEPGTNRYGPNPKGETAGTGPRPIPSAS